MAKHIPLALYVHVPWCVQKCPYCDFNSHTLKQSVPEKEYIAHLLADLDQDLKYVQGRALQSIFIGGGTPSLLSAEAILQLLQGIGKRIAFSPNIEITLEANPGTIETGRFAGFVQAGVTRISIGVQSFQTKHLKTLGRIHDNRQSFAAIKQANEVGLRTYNMDLMHGLPQQSIVEGLSDLETALSFAPPHLSWYQLTIEPNTQFASKPPVLPEDEVLWDIQERGHALLKAAGYEQYEVSAYAKPGQQCQHNLNYWQFGDYLGIGCGAHGKVTYNGTIIRTEKIKHPRGYMDLQQDYLYRSNQVNDEDVPFEYFMNRLRLFAPFTLEDYEVHTLQPLPQQTRHVIERALASGFLIQSNRQITLTSQGQRYLNTLLAEFID